MLYGVLFVIASKHCICPAIERPVCGIDAVTYDNACFAQCNDTHVDYVGRCCESGDVDRDGYVGLFSDLIACLRLKNSNEQRKCAQMCDYFSL